MFFYPLVTRYLDPCVNLSQVHRGFMDKTPCIVTVYLIRYSFKQMNSVNKCDNNILLQMIVDRSFIKLLKY